MLHDQTSADGGALGNNGITRPIAIATLAMRRLRRPVASTIDPPERGQPASRDEIRTSGELPSTRRPARTSTASPLPRRRVCRMAPLAAAEAPASAQGEREVASLRAHAPSAHPTRPAADVTPPRHLRWPIIVLSIMLAALYGLGRVMF